VGMKRGSDRSDSGDGRYAQRRRNGPSAREAQVCSGAARCYLSKSEVPVRLGPG